MSRLRFKHFAAPWTPFNLGTNVVSEWWSAQDYKLMVDDGSGLISSWKSRVSGLAVTAVNTVRPIWSATGFKSTYPGVTFDGVANCLISTTMGNMPTGSNAGEIWAVYSTTLQNSVIAEYGGVDGTAVARRIAINGSQQPTCKDGLTVLTDSTTVPSNVGQIQSGVWSGTTQSGFRNGIAFTNNPGTITSLNTGTTRIRIGSTNTASASAFFIGPITDILVASGTLSTSQRQKMEGYFAWQYGLQSTLGSSHPYFYKRPFVSDA